MSIPRILLGFLEETPRHGYDLKQTYDRFFGREKPLPFGQVYSTLGRLERDGLVEEHIAEPGKGPDRRLYAITPEGVTDLDAWLNAPEPAEPFIRSTLFGKVVLALLSGRSARGYLQIQRAEHERRMQELTKMKNEGDLQMVVLADYALFHLEADLRWMELTEGRLQRLRKEIAT